MTSSPTFSDSHLRRLRAKHAKVDEYGRHRHLYLHETMRALVGAAGATETSRSSLLDYGCGKGRFMEEMRGLGLFGEIAGYDPAVAEFQARPERQYDFVTCLDVLDASERFAATVVADVARVTANTAIFDCLTKPAPKSGFPPHPSFYWI